MSRVSKTVFRHAAAGQGHGPLLPVHAGEGERALPLQQQEAHKPRAAAEIADPEPGAQPGQGGEQEAVRPRREEGIVPEEAETAGGKLLPVLHGDPSLPSFLRSILAQAGLRRNGQDG